jgi:hypothetical protein
LLPAVGIENSVMVTASEWVTPPTAHNKTITTSRKRRYRLWM